MSPRMQTLKTGAWSALSTEIFDDVKPWRPHDVVCESVASWTHACCIASAGNVHIAASARIHACSERGENAYLGPTMVDVRPFHTQQPPVCAQKGPNKNIQRSAIALQTSAFVAIDLRHLAISISFLALSQGQLPEKIGTYLCFVSYCRHKLKMHGMPRVRAILARILLAIAFRSAPGSVICVAQYRTARSECVGQHRAEQHRTRRSVLNIASVQNIAYAQRMGEYGALYRMVGG
eukprot:39117-Rhodomonas_salina.1